MAHTFQSKAPIIILLLHPIPLNQVLYVPNLIKNLLSVRRLTTYNNVSIKFDPNGFLVKDLQTRMPLLSCNSSGDLYPLTLKSTPPLKSPSTFAAIN